MNFQPPNWPYWPHQSPPHSTETEHRLTELEAAAKRIDPIDRRLNLHEKAILAILGVLQIVLQDKYPLLAKALKGLLQ